MKSIFVFLVFMLTYTANSFSQTPISELWFSTKEEVKSWKNYEPTSENESCLVYTEHPQSLFEEIRMIYIFDPNLVMVEMDFYEMPVDVYSVFVQEFGLGAKVDDYYIWYIDNYIIILGASEENSQYTTTVYFIESTFAEKTFGE